MTPSTRRWLKAAPPSWSLWIAPCWPPSSAVGRASWPTPSAIQTTPASIATVEILVVEDEEGIADFLSRGLEAEGYEVTVVGEGITGERLALSGAADLVVLDRMLPGRDGIDVLGAIREKKPGLPVIMLTAR